jgi:hypothetical protein
MGGAAMTVWSADPMTVDASDLVKGMDVLRPEWVLDESGKRFDPRVEVPKLPYVLRVKVWDWDEGESNLEAHDGSVSIDYNTADYPKEFTLVGEHTNDPIFDDAQDVGQDLKLQDPRDCRILAWGAPWLRNLTDEQEQNALWVQLTICRPGFEGAPPSAGWDYTVYLMRGEDEVEFTNPDSWADARAAIVDFRKKVKKDRGGSKGSKALDEVNRHRRSMGQSPLDPVTAGWSERDVELEAARIRKLNPDVVDLKKRCMR